MIKNRLSGESVAPNMRPYAGVGALAVPVTAIALQLAQSGRHLGDRRFKLLQANHIGSLALDPLENLRLSGADAVHIPGGDFEHYESIKSGAPMFNAIGFAIRAVVKRKFTTTARRTGRFFSRSKGNPTFVCFASSLQISG